MINVIEIFIRMRELLFRSMTIENYYRQINLIGNFSCLITMLCDSLFTHTMIRKPWLEVNEEKTLIHNKQNYVLLDQEKKSKLSVFNSLPIA